MVRIIFTAFRRRWFFPQAGYVDAGSPVPRPYRVRAAATRTATKSAKSASSAGVVEGSTIVITSSTILLKPAAFAGTAAYPKTPMLNDSGA